jgi:hypothetical protein
MSNPTRIGQEAPDLKTPSSPSRITPTRALDDDAEHQMTKSEPPAPKYPYAVDEAGVARVGFVAVDPAQHNKATELQLWPLFGSKLTFARPHMRAFHFQWLSFFVAFMAWFASVWNHAMASVNLHAVEPRRNLIPTQVRLRAAPGHHPPGLGYFDARHLVEQRLQRGGLCCGEICCRPVGIDN